MKKAIRSIMVILMIFAFSNVDAQEVDLDGVLNGTYVRSRVSERKPVPYQYVRESDVLWSKTIWRIIDLRQKMNLKLYYPEDKLGVPEGRYNLADLLMYAIENEGVKAYNPNADMFDEFAEIMSIDQIKKEMDAQDQEIEVEENGKWVKKKIPGKVSSAEIKEILVKEEWFFDKQRSVMEVRIVGLCPIRHYYKPNDIDRENLLKKKVFWVYFPEIRKVLANHFVFNPQNEAKNWSFDDVFHLRYFDSYITQESNTYNNRRIEEYATGRDALFEAEKIKRNIMNYEQDLWVY